MSNFFELNEQNLQNFARVSQSVGARADYVQGGGGNASCKHDDNKMAIKASGFTIGEITETAGYADVDFIKVKEFHTDVPQSIEKQCGGCIIDTGPG